MPTLIEGLALLGAWVLPLLLAWWLSGRKPRSVRERIRR